MNDTEDSQGLELVFTVGACNEMSKSGSDRAIGSG
jgi:hypothetical protein